MPNNRKSTLKKIKNNTEVHPGSRKAAQINRVHLRAAKLVSAKKCRKDLGHAKLYRPNWFLEQIAGPQAYTLPELRDLVSEGFIKRNDDRIAELEAERRPGRPKAKEQVDLEELKRVELSEWETGFEVINLTDHKATHLMNQWVEAGMSIKSAQNDLLPWVRLARSTPDVVITSRAGRLAGMGLSTVSGEAAALAAAAKGQDADME